MHELKPIFQLNKAQKRISANKERESFNRHCKRFNWNPKDKEREFYKDFIKRDWELFEGLSQRVDVQNYKVLIRAFNPLFSSRDYWGYMHLQWAVIRQGIIDLIIRAAPILPINYAYCSHTAMIMGLPDVQKQNANSLQNFLLNVPLMHLYDLEFNAFVTGESLFNDIPAVCIYTSVPDFAEHFTNLFLSCLVVHDIEHRVAFPSLEDLRGFSNIPEFKKSCLSSMKMLCGVSPRVYIAPKYYFSKLHPKLTKEFLTALRGSSIFVNLHEYGHLLMGHLELEPGPFLEFKADVFATRVLLQTAADDQELQWIALGIATIFNIFEMYEALYSAEPVTHPKAADRLSSLQNDFRDMNILEAALAFELMWSPLKKAINVVNQ